MSEDDVAQKLAVHEAICAERWKQAEARLKRIELVLLAIVVLLLFGDLLPSDNAKVRAQTITR